MDVDPSARIGFVGFLVIGIIFGGIWFFIDGFHLSGFLKRSIEITSNAFDTHVKVLFGDIFVQDGWKTISVNEYFDSSVDGKHVSENSLHGFMLKTYWGGNIVDWDRQIDVELQNIQPIENLTTRPIPGKPIRYAIGTTAKVMIKENDFLCVASARTDVNTLQASSSLDDLNEALHGLLQKARIVCSGEVLNIPLIGSGLARTGIKPNMVVNLILLAVFEETKQSKITNEIRIVLPKTIRKQIDLTTIQKNWE